MYPALPNLNVLCKQMQLKHIPVSFYSQLLENELLTILVNHKTEVPKILKTPSTKKVILQTCFLIQCRLVTVWKITSSSCFTQNQKIST